jgi:hypothetical protein
MICGCDGLPLVDGPRTLYSDAIGWETHGGSPWMECSRTLGCFFPSSDCSLLPSSWAWMFSFIVMAH